MDNRPNFEDSGGLLPAVAQDAETGEVLMLAWMNRDAWEATAAGGRAVYWSRSRRRLWRKGERSGREQIVKEILLDCDRDTILLKVQQVGEAACHTGRRSCFYYRLEGDALRVISEPMFDPGKVYG